MNSFVVIVVCGLSAVAFGFPMFKNLDEKYEMCAGDEEDLRVLADQLCTDQTATRVNNFETIDALIADCCIGKCSGNIIKEHFCPEQSTGSETDSKPRSKRLIDESKLPFTTIPPTTIINMPSTTTTTTTITTGANKPICYPYRAKIQVLSYLLGALPIPITPIIRTEEICRGFYA